MKWIRNIFRGRKTPSAEIAALRNEIAQALGVLHARIDDINVAVDADALTAFRHTVRMPCSVCGQMSWKYAVDKDTGKIRCTDCVKTGL